MTRNKHDRYIQYVRHLIQDHYTSISQEVIYKEPRSNNQLGEVDIMALHEDGRDVFEIKSNLTKNGLEKAIGQLQRACEFFDDVEDAYLYTPQTGIIELDDAILLREKTKLGGEKK